MTQLYIHEPEGEMVRVDLYDDATDLGAEDALGNPLPLPAPIDFFAVAIDESDTVESVTEKVRQLAAERGEELARIQAIQEAAAPFAGRVFTV